MCVVKLDWGVFVVCAPYYTTTHSKLSRKNFSRCLGIFIFVHGLGSLTWQFSFLRRARNNFNFHFYKTAGQSGCPFSFSFAMAAKPIHIYYTLLDEAANRCLYAVGKFDKRYPYGLQLEKNLYDIAFCYIFIPKCDMAKWYIQNAAKCYVVVRACLLRSVACAPSLRARPTRLRSLCSFQEKGTERRRTDICLLCGESL